MSGPAVALNVKFVLKPARRAEFLDVIQKDAMQTNKTEPGAFKFAVGQDTEDSNVFHLHEQYMTKEDYDYHQNTVHFVEFKALSESDPFAEDPVVNVYQCQHVPIKIAP
jgi:quinol monooxygenase YgiN